MAKNGFSMSNRVAVEAVTAGSTKTLTVDDCGKLLYVAQGSSITTINLPYTADAEDGWNVTVVKSVSGSSSANINISSSASDSNKMQGVELSDAATEIAADNIAIAGVALAGTQVELVKVGEGWVVVTRASTDGSIATS
jgi:hypothetical protein